MEEGRSIVCCTATSQSRTGCVDNDCPGRWGQGWKNSFSSDLGTAITAQCYAIHMFVVRLSWTKVQRGLFYKCGTDNWVLHIAHDDANKWPRRVDVCIGYPVLSMLISVCTASYEKNKLPCKMASGSSFRLPSRNHCHHRKWQVHACYCPWSPSVGQVVEETVLLRLLTAQGFFIPSLNLTS